MVIFKYLGRPVKRDKFATALVEWMNDAEQNLSAADHGLWVCRNLVGDLSDHPGSGKKVQCSNRRDDS